MDISLSDVGKKYRSDFVFRHLNVSIPSGSKLAIAGHNGSGKSTLLRLLSSSLTPSEGELDYTIDSKSIELDKVAKKVMYCAPYVDLIPSLTVEEMMDFHFKFAPKLFSPEEMWSDMKLDYSREFQLSELSSGMLQRLKLVLALSSDVHILLMDEPTTNLDEEGKLWLTKSLSERLNQRTLVIASNEQGDIDLCDSVLDIMKFKN